MVVVKNRAYRHMTHAEIKDELRMGYGSGNRREVAFVERLLSLKSETDPDFYRDRLEKIMSTNSITARQKNRLLKDVGGGRFKTTKTLDDYNLAKRKRRPPSNDDEECPTSERMKGKYPLRHRGRPPLKKTTEDDPGRDPHVREARKPKRRLQR